MPVSRYDSGDIMFDLCIVHSVFKYCHNNYCLFTFAAILLIHQIEYRTVPYFFFITYYLLAEKLNFLVYMDKKLIVPDYFCANFELFHLFTEL